MRTRQICWSALTHLEPQSRFGDKPVWFTSRLSPKRDCGPIRVKHYEMKTWKTVVKKARPEWTINRECIQNGENSILDLIAVENGSSKETGIHVCAADVGATNHCLIWTVSRRELPNIGEQEIVQMKNRSNRRRETGRVYREKMGQKCRAIFPAVGKNRHNK